MPRFLDIEASSLGRRSYPIEVAWSDDDRNIENYLINFHEIDEWTDWNPDSQKIHGITKEQCREDGIHPRWLCNFMSNSIKPNEIIYADGGEFDAFWIDILFGVGSDLGYATFRVMHSDPIMMALLRNTEKSAERRFDLFKELKQEARRIVIGRHRATVDVQYLIELYKLCYTLSMTI